MIFQLTTLKILTVFNTNLQWVEIKRIPSETVTVKQLLHFPGIALPMSSYTNAQEPQTIVKT